jgi:epsilon-lactone hydrolase
MNTLATPDAVDLLVERIRATYARWGRDTSVAQMRADWDALFSATGTATVQPVDAAGVPCMWVTAPNARDDKVIAYFHGGGFQVGSLASHRELMADLSAAAQVRVLGIDYRMTPEHRYPAPLEDGLTVMAWLQTQGLAGADLALAGDSAGGGLALATLLAMGEQHRPRPAAAFVMSAWTDMTASGTSYETHAGTDPIHQRPMMQALARNYLGRAHDPADPFASPLLAQPTQLGQLPPVLLQVGERETLLSDSQDFAQRVRAAGGQADCQVWPGMIHVFQQFPRELAQAREAMAQAGAFLATHLGTAPHNRENHR